MAPLGRITTAFDVREQVAGAETLRPEPFREFEAWVTFYRSLWEARLDRFGEAVEKKRRTRAVRHKEKRNDE